MFDISKLTAQTLILCKQFVKEVLDDVVMTMGKMMCRYADVRMCRCAKLVMLNLFQQPRIGSAMFSMTVRELSNSVHPINS